MDSLVKIASGIMGLALIGLLISRSSDTAKVISQGGDTFNRLLQTATFQSMNGIR